MTFRPTCPRCRERLNEGATRCPSCRVLTGYAPAVQRERREPSAVVPEWGEGRYRVTEIEGFATADARVASLSAHVVDTRVCHRVVFTARTDEVAGEWALTPWERRERVRGLARARAMELNAAAAA